MSRDIKHVMSYRPSLTLVQITGYCHKTYLRKLYRLMAVPLLVY